MDRDRGRRPLVGVNRSRRIRGMHAAGRHRLADHHPPAITGTDEAALALLSEILTGDGSWTLAEVQRLIELRDAVDGGRWQATGLDGDGARP